MEQGKIYCLFELWCRSGQWYLVFTGVTAYFFAIQAQGERMCRFDNCGVSVRVCHQRKGVAAHFQIPDAAGYGGVRSPDDPFFQRIDLPYAQHIFDEKRYRAQSRPAAEIRSGIFIDLVG